MTVGQTEAMKACSSLFAGKPTTIFETMSRLAAKHGSVNLGQGFPDDALEGPDSMKRIVGDAVFKYTNQYPPLMGLAELRQAIVRHEKRHHGFELDWQTEVLVTVGASEALASAFLGMLNPGDEVVAFDPLYDQYASLAATAGAVLVPVKLRLPDLSFDRDELAAAFSDKTKFVLLNTPHNPLGKVFDEEELQYIAELVQRYNSYAVLDEVYEHHVFPGHVHRTLRALPGMQQRCVRIGSAGKTFSFTAWKVGWLTGPAHLVSVISKAHQFIVFTVPSNLQRAVAYGLDEEQSFYREIGTQLAAKRQPLAARLSAMGFDVLPAQGTYFLTADFRPLLPAGSVETDVEFAQRLTTEAGVTVIPVSAFYASPDAPRHLVRFCFCKCEDKLESACERLEKYLGVKAATVAQAG